MQAPITGLHGAVDVLVAQLKLQQIERGCLLARSKLLVLSYNLCDQVIRFLIVKYSLCTLFLCFL